MQQVVAAMDSTSVQVFELGTTSAVATVTSGIGQANAIAFDTSGNLYVANCESGCSLSGTDAVLEYAPPYTGTPVAITTGISKPESLGFDTNGNLYVANYNANVNGNVTKFAPPFTSSSVAVTTYTNGIGSPIALALDPANDLFVASLQGNSGNGTVSGYKASNSGGLADYGPITQGVQIPAAIALDASANLYVASPSGYKITKYYGYNAVVSGQTAYTCTSTCGNGISANPRTITGCNSCSASTFTPVALITLPTSSNAPLGYALFAADKTNNAVYEYSNGTNTSNTVSRSITSNVLGPAGLLLDASANLYVANQTAGTVTQYNATTYPFASTITSAFTNPTALAILP
jgi:sugar lactone lactonase YvrE